jgi:thioredoxin 1
LIDWRFFIISKGSNRKPIHLFCLFITMLKVSAILLALIVAPQQAAGLMPPLAEKSPGSLFYSNDIGSLRTNEIQKELNLRGISYQDCYNKEGLIQRLVDAIDVAVTTSVIPEEEENEEIEELRAMSVRDLREECNKRLIRWGTFRDQEELVQAIWKDMRGSLTFSVSGAIQPGKVAQLTGEQLDQEVANSGTPILLDVFATWCGPCKIMSPHLEAAAAELGGKCRVAKIDCEKYPEWAAKYKIKGLPTVLVMKQGMIVDRLEGAAVVENIVRAVQPHV